MFNGMMDPELFKLAQEQMNRMSPAELAKIQQQMMSNPDLLKMASEGMKNMRPEDLRLAAEQLKHVRPEEMAEIGEKMANAGPEEIASIRSRADAQMNYQLSAAEMLKKEGNQLHSQAKFEDASQKYLRAKENLKGVVSIKAKALLLACSLNLMSCNLKTKKYDDCIKEGSEVLAYDAKNVKALYRRGQAYKELGQLDDAVLDLRKAHEVSPDDETIEQVLSGTTNAVSSTSKNARELFALELTTANQDAEERLSREGSTRASRGLVIEEIIEENEPLSSVNHRESSTVRSDKQAIETNGTWKSQSDVNTGSLDSMSNSECLNALKDDPDAIRTFQNFISNADPTTLAAIGGKNAGDVPTDMLKTASNMISKMSPEELQRMIQLASSFPGDNNPLSSGSGGASSDTSFDSFKPGAIPNLSPDMLKTAGEMMGKMSPEEVQRMFSMASSLGGNSGFPAADRPSSSSVSSLPDGEETSTISTAAETSTSRSAFPQGNFPSSPADLQEQMRNQMKDPAMRQMFSSMIKNMSPEMMANMGEQFGVKLSPEDAVKAQQAMSSLSPEDLDRMMRWADRVQRGVDTAKKTKNWLLGRSGLILAICMLILAVILHRLGYIG